MDKRETKKTRTVFIEEETDIQRMGEPDMVVQRENASVKE